MRSRAAMDRIGGLTDEHTLNGAGEAGPALGFCLELPPSGAGQSIEAGAALVFGDGPLGRDPAALLHPVQRWIERSLFHLQNFGRQLLQPERNAVTVLRPAREDFQY